MGTAGEFGSMRHLAARFFGALNPTGPPPADEAWATGHLLPGELDLWRRMSGPDRRHAVGVARGAIGLAGPGAGSREFVAAALLHDVGKVSSRLGTFGRVGVTIAAMAAGRERLVATGSGRSGLRGRVSGYLSHDRVGADLLTAAGSDPFTVAWAREHHLAAGRWSVERRLGEALKAADGD